MLNHKEIIKGRQSVTKIKTFIDKYNWEEIDFQSGKDD